jgi:hypothetical protein
MAGPVKVIHRPPGCSTESLNVARDQAFQEQRRELGYTEGQHLVVE